jgi:pilus assembly protein Flp/PilA
LRSDNGRPGGLALEVKEREMKMFVEMLKDNSGASAAEYALILAIVGSALALAAIALGNTISGAMNNAGNKITNNL